MNLGDITNVDENSLKPFTMICGGSPCQDFSIAGKQKGSRWQCADCGYEYNPLTVHFSERDKCPQCGSSNLDKTRSSMLVEWLRIVMANKPVWGIYENVKNIVSKRFKDTFDLFIAELQEYGYNCYWQVLNAKNYGIPQNRERLYLIIILKEYDNGQFSFPKPVNNGKALIDMLEDDVEEKYYINTEKARSLVIDLLNDGVIESSTRQDKTRQDKTRQDKTRQGIDLCVHGAGIVDNACCITARYDSGIGNRRKEKSGVLEINNAK